MAQLKTPFWRLIQLQFAVLGRTMGVPPRNATFAPSDEQAETAPAGPANYPPQTLQHPHRTGLLRLARKHFVYALKIRRFSNHALRLCIAFRK